MEQSSSLGLPIDGPSEVSFSGERRNYCVCYVDLVNSTQATAGIPEEKVGRYYSIFINAMARIARNFHASVMKNVGDSLICYFPRTSDPTDGSAFQDVLECCIAMIDAYPIISKEVHAEGLQPTRYRISADYGSVEIATSRSSKSYDLFGPVMNLCKKINPMVEPGGMVIGGNLYRILKSFSFRHEYLFREFVGYSRGLPYEYPICHIARKTKNTSDPFTRSSASEGGQMHPEVSAEANSMTDQWQKCSHNIMLVDDEQDICDVFKSVLSVEGYNVDAFVTPEKALEHFTKAKPSYYDLVILDIRMPDINGLRLYEKLKSINPAVRILFVSALDTAEELIKYLPNLKDGDLLRKPVAIRELVARLKTAITR